QGQRSTGVRSLPTLLEWDQPRHRPLRHHSHRRPNLRDDPFRQQRAPLVRAPTIAPEPIAASLTQPLVQEFDHAFTRLVGRLAVDLTNLVGQHRMRHPREPALIAWARIDFDDLERVAELVLERLESLARRHLVFTEPQAD